jgi:hypothetical protein
MIKVFFIIEYKETIAEDHETNRANKRQAGSNEW